MDIRNAVLILAGILNAVLGTFILFQKSKNSSHCWYAAAVFFAALWALSIFGFRTADSILYARAWMQLAYIAALLIGVNLFFFAFAFPDSGSPPLIYRLPLYILVGLLIFATASPDFFVADVFAVPGGREVTLLPYGKFLFAVFFSFFFFGAAAVLWRRFRVSGGILRAQYAYILGGILVPGIFGVIFNLILPFAGDHGLIWLGPLFLFLMVAAIGYAMLKHHLFDIKIIATELLIFSIWTFLFIRVLVANTIEQRLVDAGLLVLVIFFGILLVKSVYGEVKTREKIAGLADKLAAANEELKKLDEAKSEFISLAGHQLRAPLTVIRGYISLLLEGRFGKITEQAADGMKKVSISAEELVKLVSDLLDLSRIEAGRMKYNFQPILLDDVAGEVVRELEVNAKAKGIGLSFVSRNAAKTAVSADPDKFREIVMNLVDNAVKYTAAGSVAVELYPETYQDRGWLVLKVSDTGIGIKPSDIPALFAKFARTEEAKRVRADGLGLGLYFVKRIVDDHGGRLWVESPGAGKGSAFFVALPSAA